MKPQPDTSLGCWAMPRSRGGKSGYRTAKIPEELAEIVDKVVESKRYGYRSFNEFVVEAVRLRLRDMGLMP